MESFLKEGDVHLVLHLLSYVDHNTLIASVSVNKRFYILIYRLLSEFRGQRISTFQKLKEKLAEANLHQIDGFWSVEGNIDRTKHEVHIESTYDPFRKKFR